MNIIVPVPKSEVAHFWEEVPGAAVEWWTMSRRPTQFYVGDYIYFAIRGKAVARAKVFTITNSSKFCDTTGRKWTGHHLTWKAGDFETLDDSPLRCTVTRGFQYLGIES